MTQNKISKLESILKYRFSNRNLILEALSHRSFINEQTNPGLKDNERLEFLGDAVVSLSIGHILMHRHPNFNEGELSKIRANLVNESQLAIIAKELSLGSFIRLGKGEIQTRGRNKKSILADTYEAVVAAIYLDGGYDAAFKSIKKHFSSLVKTAVKTESNHDYKSRLQEIVQSSKNMTPSYEIIQTDGPDHDKTFVASLKIQAIETQGVGKSKKLAEQDAAHKALNLLK